METSKDVKEDLSKKNNQNIDILHVIKWKK